MRGGEGNQWKDLSVRGKAVGGFFHRCINDLVGGHLKAIKNLGDIVFIGEKQSALRHIIFRSNSDKFVHSAKFLHVEMLQMIFLDKIWLVLVVSSNEEIIKLHYHD